MSDTPVPNDGPEEVKKPATVTPIKQARTRKAKEEAPKTVDDLDLEILTECGEHTTADGKPMLVFMDGQKPTEVVKEAIEVVVTENDASLALGGFHDDLVFRNGKGGGFVTLAKDDADRVVIKPLSKANIAMALQARFCYVTVVEEVEEVEPQAEPGLARHGLTYGRNEYRFPMLNGLLQLPAIHLDGTVVTREGFDPVTEVLGRRGLGKTSRSRPSRRRRRSPRRSRRCASRSRRSSSRATRSSARARSRRPART